MTSLASSSYLAKSLFDPHRVVDGIEVAVTHIRADGHHGGVSGKVTLVLPHPAQHCAGRASHPQVVGIEYFVAHANRRWLGNHDDILDIGQGGHFGTDFWTTAGAQTRNVAFGCRTEILPPARPPA